MGMIELTGVEKRYGATVAVRSVSLTVDEGELLVLLGGSGSGKTTTLKMINRLIEPTAGTILVDGADVLSTPAHELRRRIGYVFQKIGLFPHMSVAENVGITPRLLGWSKAAIEARVDELLELVELDPSEIRHRSPAELSGGQQQRVGVARALAARPKVMLFDEPFGALDPITRERLQQSVIDIRKQLGLTAIFVTHDMIEALLMGDRIAVMKDGLIVQIGPPRELLFEPKDDYVRQLMETPKRQVGLLEELSRRESS
jgi:osmoprotectant transport system ATP-binding protein